MITRKYKNINNNSFVADINIVAQYPTGVSNLEFKALINANRGDINVEQNGMLHHEANVLNFTLLPSSSNLSDVQPIEFEFIGSWTAFIAGLKMKLVEINRTDEAMSAKLTFTVNEMNTKYIKVVSARDTQDQKYVQHISETDVDYASVKKVMDSIARLKNKESLEQLGNYIYHIMVA